MRKKSLWMFGMTLTAAAVLLSACGNSGGGGGCGMTGTITNNSSIDLTGATYTIGLDADTTMNNGNEVATFQAVWPGGTTADYAIDISSVPAGSYYVWVEVDGPGYLLQGLYEDWTPINQTGQIKIAPIGCGVSISLAIDEAAT